MQWQSIYNDGTIINEGEVKSSEEIDRTKLKEFRLFDGDKLVFVAFFNTNRKLIFRKRRFCDGAGELQSTVYLVGWHENIKGVSVKSICYVYEDGHIEFDDSRNDLELMPVEMF
jgi:hypothetical protein